MDREARVLATEEMVAIIFLGQYILDLKAFPVRYVMEMEVPDVLAR